MYEKSNPHIWGAGIKQKIFGIFSQNEMLELDWICSHAASEALVRSTTDVGG